MLSILLAIALPCRAQTDADRQAVGQAAYLFAYPLVLMSVTRQAAGENNQFAHLRAFPDDKFHQVVRPNADTLYSTAWLDLSKEPVLMRVPDTNGRYYLMQILDAWTETVSVPGKRTTGTTEGWFAIVGPGWKGELPDKAVRIDCPTSLAWIIGRTQTNGVSDYANVHAVQEGYHLMPLSRYPDGVTGKGSGATAPSREARIPPPELVARMSAAEFFGRFITLLDSNPPHGADAPMMARLRAFGFDHLIAADDSLKAGVEQARQVLAGLNAGRSRNNLSPTNWSKLASSVGRYGTNYIARAAIAKAGLGANPPEDAVYLGCSLDAKGAALDGSQRYRIHFDKSQLPPVKAFWSIATYDAQGYFAANAIGRYAIGDRDKLQFNEDGSLDLYIQHEPPAGQADNWLPVPAASFNLTMRLYWPGDEILSGRWTPPPVTPQLP